jgi:hypothetical protein
MAARRRSGQATARASPRAARVADEARDERYEDLTSQMRALGAAVALLVDRERERVPERPTETPAETTRALELMAQAMSHLSTRVRDGRDAGSGSDGEVLATEERGAEVPEIRVADPRFHSLLSVHSYLLTRRSPHVLPRQVARLSKRAVELRPRLGTSFGGRSPLAVLPFLQRVREIAEEAGLSEGVVLRLFPDLLSEPALTSFRSAKPSTYPEAVKWLLLTYAPETRVTESWRDLQQLKQEDPETATEFALRLQAAAHQLGGLVSATELKALYEGGLQDGTRHLFRATLPPNPDRTLADSVAAAESLYQAVRVTRGDREHPSGPHTRSRAARGIFAIAPGGAGTQEVSEENVTNFLEPDVDWGTVVCYGAHGHHTQGRPRGITRVCWTCWLPGHFSDECPLIPLPMRAEIADRKRKALAESGYQPRAGPLRGGQQRSWGRGEPPPRRPESDRTVTVPTEQSAGDEERRGTNAPAPRL